MHEETAEILREYCRQIAAARRLTQQNRESLRVVRMEIAEMRAGLEERLALRRQAVSLSAWTDWQVPDEADAAPAAGPALGQTGSVDATSAVGALVFQAEAAAVNNAAALEELVRQIKALIGNNSEPGVLAGILIEGAAQAIGLLVPPPERAAFVAAALTLLCERVSLLPATPA